MSGKRASVRRARGFAVVEAALSALIIGLMMVAALELVARSRSSQAVSAARLRGHQLASVLMAEISEKSYADKGEPTVLLGREVSELLSARNLWNDVDDFHGLSESPPKKRDGTVIPGATGYSWTVSVAYVPGADLSADSLIDSGYKRITVSVFAGGKKVAELVSLRTAAVNR